MKKICYIFTGGEVHSLSAAPCKSDLVIAADSGYTTAKRFGITPNLLVGDLDSLDRGSINDEELAKIEKIIVPSVKDDTDTQLAVDMAIERGAENIILVGGLGGRLDHTLSNVFLLEYIAERGIECILTDGQNRGRLLAADGVRQCIEIKREYKYLSLISLSERCDGVSVSGVYYPLEGAQITRKYTYAISNIITADFAKISVENGHLLVVESGD